MLTLGQCDVCRLLQPEGTRILLALQALTNVATILALYSQFMSNTQICYLHDNGASEMCVREIEIIFHSASFALHSYESIQTLLLRWSSKCSLCKAAVDAFFLKYVLFIDTPSLTQYFTVCSGKWEASRSLRKSKLSMYFVIL
jgi:hypothetical protein